MFKNYGLPKKIYSPVSYNFAVESLKMPIVFKLKLYEHPKDNFSLQIIGKYK